jgi:hypothetical protein
LVGWELLMVAKSDMDRASEVEAAYRVREGFYTIGRLKGAGLQVRRYPS